MEYFSLQGQLFISIYKSSSSENQSIFFIKMGTKRVEGKKKKKSIKSKVTSLDSDKKILSRMGKKIKKGLMK